MKSLHSYINESIEDGKYLDLPELKGISKVSLKWLKGDAKKEAQQKFKEHEKLLKQIDSENLDILVDKIKKFMAETARRDDFISSQVSAILHEKEQSRNKKSSTEDDLDNLILTLRKSISTDTEDKLISSRYNNWDNRNNPLQHSIYQAISSLARLYQLDVPKFSEDAVYSDSLESVYQRVERELDNRATYKMSSERVSDLRSKLSDKAQAKYDKDAQKLIKLREAFKKTKLYSDIVEIIDMFEDDIEKISSLTDRAYERYNTRLNKSKISKDAYEHVKELAIKTLNDYFNNNTYSVYGVKLIDVLAAIYIAKKDDNPKIEPVNPRTSSWLAGLCKSCEFKVTDKDGETYFTGRYEDQGIKYEK